MPTLSTAQLYFEKIVSPEFGYEYVEDLVIKKMREGESLDFKAGGKLRDDDINSIWSKALSGFANTSGGVMIFGVDARKDNDGIDAASAIDPHPDADALVQRLADTLLNAVTPPIKGVRIEAVKKQGEKAGFVACLVPEGDLKAYRAELSAKQFFVRINDSFVVPPVALIRSLFYPKASAILLPSIIVTPFDRHANRHQPLTLAFGLKNIGTLTARNISISISHEETFAVVSENRGLADPYLLEERRYLMNVTRNINPGVQADDIYWLKTSDLQQLRDGLHFKVRLSCEDAPLREWTRYITIQELLTFQRLEFVPKGDSRGKEAI